MNILGKILTFPITGPIDGFMAIVKTLQKQAEEQLERQTPQARLADLESKLASGEITADEYKEEEEVILKELDEQLKQAQEGG